MLKKILNMSNLYMKKQINQKLKFMKETWWKKIQESQVIKMIVVNIHVTNVINSLHTGRAVKNTPRLPMKESSTHVIVVTKHLDRSLVFTDTYELFMMELSFNV